jgi:hypothetical protein
MHTERDKKFPHNYLAQEKTGVYMGEATYSGWQGEAGPTGAWLNPALLPGTMTIQENEKPRCCTKDKTYGGALCSMGTTLVLSSPLPSGRIQVGTLGLPGRDLPSRGEVCSCPTG